MNKEILILSGLLNDETEISSKLYPTADEEYVILVIGKEISIRDVSGGPTGFLRVRVSKFIDKDTIEVVGVKSNKKMVFNTNDCEIKNK